MEHAAFANAGRTAGVEIWRIENFEPVPVPSRDYGKFYKGDSYIVLKTTANRRGELTWDIHYWLGSATSQDEAGAAAILTVGLDDKFNGAAVQHREVEGHESQQFMGYFSPAIRYVDGGHASGFNHVTTNAGAEKRLFQVKGKRNVRVRQVAPTISSMNKGDCFILDIGDKVYVYVGEQAKRVEKLKAVAVANQIRDQDHNGRATIEFVDETATEADTERFFSALGSGSRDVVPEESAGGDDQTFERGEESSVSLYEISDASGKIQSTPLPKPLRQEQLKTQECYILDTVSGSIYVWVGKQSNAKEKSEAMSKAQQFLASKKYPNWVHVARVPEGTEPAAFKQYFSTWRDHGALHSRLVRSADSEESSEEDAESRDRRIGKTGAARKLMSDQAEGSVVLYRIENMTLVKVYDSENGSVPPHKFGQLYQGDSYVLQYEYRKNGNRAYIIYYWLGKDSSKDEQIAAAIETALLDNKLSGAAVQVRVPQGHEPRHFLQLFKGRLTTLVGGKASGFRNRHAADEYDNDGVRLFQVYGTTPRSDMRAEQVPEKASSLDDDDVFILETPAQVYVWHGPGSSAAERSEAAEFVRELTGRDYVTLEKGQEPQEFWNYLGGSPVESREPAWRTRLSQRMGQHPTLYEVRVSTNMVVTFEQYNDYDQKDLTDDSVFLLDTHEEIYLWIGDEAPQHEKKAVNTITEKYLRTHHVGRQAVIVVVKQGMEPTGFTRLFDDWDQDMWKKQKSYSAIKDDMLANNEV